MAPDEGKRAAHVQADVAVSRGSLTTGSFPLPAGAGVLTGFLLRGPARSQGDGPGPLVRTVFLEIRSFACVRPQVGS